MVSDALLWEALNKLEESLEYYINDGRKINREFVLREMNRLNLIVNNAF